MIVHPIVITNNIGFRERCKTMRNVDALLDVANHIDEHPDEYSFGWQDCVAGHLARQAGYTINLSETVRDPNYNGADPHVSSWAQDFLGISIGERENLFVFMKYTDERDDSEVDFHDAHAVADFVRWFANTQL